MLMHQIRYTLRTLRRSPAFTAMAILTVALGVGANTAVFSVVDAVLLQPLPYAEPDRLVALSEQLPSLPSSGRSTIDATHLAHYRLAQSFDGFAIYNRHSRTLTRSGEPMQILGEEVSANLFTLLGVSAAIGRVFGPEHGVAGGQRAVILTDALWRAKFGGDPAILGRTIQLNDEPHEVIGVMPPGFQSLSGPGSGFTISFFVPSAFGPTDGRTGGAPAIDVVGRLKPGVSIERAREELRSLSASLPSTEPSAATASPSGERRVATIAPLRDVMVYRFRLSLLVLLGAVGLVLVIACVNLANLLIVRAIGQGREVAIRMAIGASRARITVDLALRGLVLGVIGGAAGLIFGLWTRNLLASMAPPTMSWLDQPALNPRVLGVTFGLSAITGIVAGLLPALQLWRGNAAPTLRASALTTSGVRSMARGRGLLMAAEIAAALTLAVGAGLLVQSLVRLASVDLGFQTSNVLMFTVRPPQTRYPDPAARARLFAEIEQRLQTLPGVMSTAVASDFPLRGGGRGRLTIVGDARPGAEAREDGSGIRGATSANDAATSADRAAATPATPAAHGPVGTSGVGAAPGARAAGSAGAAGAAAGAGVAGGGIGGQSVAAGFSTVSPGYFATLRIPLVRGRLLTGEDRAGAPPTAVVSELFARRFLAGRNPIGARFRRDLPGAPDLTIVGVVQDLRRDGRQRALMPQVYVAAAQTQSYVHPSRPVELDAARLAEIAVRSTGDPRVLVPAIQRAVWSIDPDQPIMGLFMMDEIVAGETMERRFTMTLLSAVALLAFTLALVGVYGVVAHAAAQRTREIGIRVALGARRSHVVSLVVAGGLQWALLGVIVGLAGAYAGTRVMATLLFGISPTDLPTYAGLAVLMLTVAALASYVPARRAASINPVSALRAD